ncbi:hypothetical protein [Clostridium saccharobutylicum]|uniref:Uncharacterized protein n=2 Tax=Clostridium saccharobutylicum TaxID=169679 RepID=U5MU94_CLOSA|nr:hypothetical protein [Clostridium saccharobutylicum]AGX44359.1 hypothetical protein CLSA_c33960 [Clostridium saccharobutylicum DSM 13864]AQR91651.1 hypothetical protein CLOSC_33770 [Clostridium saccharobutylicum]AQS01556.1 hypothetical protein CSACC_33850 [Clostridium saccharobutylicum]AQS11167.1 hypothetical protein CLOBY_33210 [Clostridium saccharobutylicum]AQS15539.1 hypothetical protein CLOSACC_33850 [Clostridium saccharobutylicum]
MKLNKKTLFLGVIFGSIGTSLYSSIKNYRKKAESINESNYPYNMIDINNDEDDSVMTSVQQLKKQTNTLEDKLNKFKTQF